MIALDPAVEDSVAAGLRSRAEADGLPCTQLDSYEYVELSGRPMRNEALSGKTTR